MAQSGGGAQKEHGKARGELSTQNVVNKQIDRLTEFRSGSSENNILRRERDSWSSHSGGAATELE